MFWAKLGAAIGSFFFLSWNVDNISGGLIGSIFGSKGGEIAVEKIYDHFSEKFGNNSSKSSE